MPSPGSTPVGQAFSELHYAESKDQVNVKVCYKNHPHHLGLLHIKADDLAKPDSFFCTLGPSESRLQSDTREAT